MNRQEAFDKAYLGIVKQGCQSLIGAGCAYRGENGTKCAIGHLITDDQMTKYEVMEGVSASALPVGLLEELIPDDRSARFFLSNLQSAHDGVLGLEDFVTKFKERAGMVAANYNLQVPQVSE